MKAFLELLRKEYAHLKPVLYEMDGDSSGITFSHNSLNMCINSAGDISVMPKIIHWVPLGNIHEPDIIDRLDKVLKRLEQSL